MNRGIVRQGFALVTAVLISAAILATIVGIATLTIRETRVQAEQNASDQALAVAERGLADVVSRLKTDLAVEAIGRAHNLAWEPPLSVDSDGITTVSTVKTGAHSFYWVKVVPDGGAGTDRDYAIYAAGFIAGENISGKTSDQLKALATDSTKVLARRVVQLTSLGIVKTSSTVHTPDDKSWPFNYGLFSGVNFEMSGSKKLANVTTDGTLGIYAAGNISPISGSGTFTNLQLYAEHDIDKDVADMLLGSSGSHPGWATAPLPIFPQLDLGKYMDLFDDFVADPVRAPFNGSKADYPDLRNPLVRSAVLAALGNPQNNVTADGHHFVTPTWLSNYTNKVVALSWSGAGLIIDQELALQRTLSKSVFYVRNSAGDPDVKWEGEREYLAGVIVSSGDIKFTGCPDFAEGQEAAFLAHGVIDIAGSTQDDSPVRGIFYAEGWDKDVYNGKNKPKGAFVDKAIVYTGSGWFEGQMISKSSVDFAGSGTLMFKNYSSMIDGLLPGSTTTTTEITGFESFSQRASGWTEKDWLKFQSPAT